MRRPLTVKEQVARARVARAATMVDRSAQRADWDNVRNWLDQASTELDRLARATEEADTAYSTPNGAF